MVIPYISRDDVSAVLSSLIHTTGGNESTGLEHLLLVDLRVTAPDMPAGDEVRRFVVRDLLVTEITSALSEIRRSFELDAPDIRASLAGELTALADNIAADSHELTTWTVLYYRFVRADLSFSVERLAELLAVHTRTIARYTDEGIDLLTQRLIAAEQAARRHHLRRRLYALLPYSVPVRLFGRDEALQSAEDALSSLSPRHILITGAAGIGKTVFVQELVRRQIDAENIDHLVWIHQPETIMSVQHQLAEALLMHPESARHEQVMLRDYLLLYRVAVVVDEIDVLSSDAEAFAALLRDLGAAFVCLISRTRIALDSVTARLHLTELSDVEAKALVQETLRLHPVLNADDRQAIAADLFEHVGGNPLALRLAAAMWESSDDWAALEAGVQSGILTRLYEQLSLDERRAWAVLALHPRPVSVADLDGLWHIRPEAFGALQRLMLTEPGSMMLIDTARDFIHAQCAVRSDVRGLLEESVARLEPDERALDVVEHALITGFPEVDLQRRTGWINCLWAVGLQCGHWVRWRTILESHLRDASAIDPDVRIAFAICLRHLAEWAHARQILTTVVAECGREGRFAAQARALLELSILSRNGGDYQQALHLIGQASRYGQRSHDVELLHSLASLEAQILIHSGDAVTARKLLASVPETTPNLTLYSEALLASRDYDVCRSAARRALRLVNDDPATEASLYTIIGRSYELEGSHEQAHGFLTDAVTLLERGDDPFALARAQTNLAAVLIPMQRYQDAGSLLSRAEAIQTRLADKVGLSATRHNRAILSGHIAG